MLHVFYSYLKISTGFFKAALVDCVMMVEKAMNNEIVRAKTNIQ